MRLELGDCLEVMGSIPDGSIDMILCDLPYGTTACKWDSIIPLEPLWEHYRRVIKRRGAIVLFGSQPFTAALIMSNPDWFKYEWIWRKNRPTGFPHAKNKPLKDHENLLVFSEGTTVHESQSSIRMPYFPQGVSRISETRRKRSNSDAVFAKRPSHGKTFVSTSTNYPRSVLEFSTDMLNVHPTAKPVALLEYLIRTYTNEGETVLDNCMGSGSTGVACANTGRDFIGIEQDGGYFRIAQSRILAAQQQLRLAI